ncbi:MAG: hypothetical protein ABI999_13040 [Acidobacteriota bacterium]
MGSRLHVEKLNATFPWRNLTNTLYHGDNLKILRDYIRDESVDLVYLDRPLDRILTPVLRQNGGGCVK